MSRLFSTCIVAFLLIFSISSCEGLNPDSDKKGDAMQPEDISIKGYAQKGQLIKGSNITAFALDSNLVATGSSYPAEIRDNAGSFTINAKSGAPYLELKAEGYYFNEVTGMIENAPIYLSAICTTASSDINVNLFTTITAPRIKKLISSGMKYQAAVTTAQNELLRALNEEGEDIDFTELDIMGSGKADAMLLAYACMILADRSASETVVLIQNAASEFESEGILSDRTVQTIKENRSSINPFTIIKNISNYFASDGLTFSELPPLHKYLDNRFSSDFLIESNGIDPIQPEFGINNGTISKSFNIISIDDFDIVCNEEFVQITKNKQPGGMYQVDILIPENLEFESRVITVTFKDKEGNELERKEFIQDGNYQLVRFRPLDYYSYIFNMGNFISANEETYNLEIIDKNSAEVKLPKLNSYFFSYPAGALRKADHIIRVTTDFPSVVDRKIQVPLYGALEEYNGLSFSNPAQISLMPATALISVELTDFPEGCYVVLSGRGEDDYLAGTFTYIPNPEQVSFYPDVDLTPIKGTIKSVTIKYQDESGAFSALLPPIPINGLKVEVYDANDQLLDIKSTTSDPINLKAGQHLRLRAQRTSTT